MAKDGYKKIYQYLNEKHSKQEDFTFVVTYCKSNIAIWKQNKIFHSFIKLLKKNKKIHKIRYLNPNNPGSTKQSFYSKEIYERLEGLYIEKDRGDNEI